MRWFRRPEPQPIYIGHVREPGVPLPPVVDHVEPMTPPRRPPVEIGPFMDGSTSYVRGARQQVDAAADAFDVVTATGPETPPPFRCHAIAQPVATDYITIKEPTMFKHPLPAGTRLTWVDVGQGATIIITTDTVYEPGHDDGTYINARCLMSDGNIHHDHRHTAGQTDRCCKVAAPEPGDVTPGTWWQEGDVTWQIRETPDRDDLMPGNIEVKADIHYRSGSVHAWSGVLDAKTIAKWVAVHPLTGHPEPDDEPEVKACRWTDEELQDVLDNSPTVGIRRETNSIILHLPTDVAREVRVVDLTGGAQAKLFDQLVAFFDGPDATWEQVWADVGVFATRYSLSVDVAAAIVKAISERHP